MPNTGWALVAAWLLVCSQVPSLIAAANVVQRAANPFTIDKWDTDAGLPQNTVTSIIQARDGYLWFGTLNGLVRFDGVRFEVFDENNTPGLESSRIVKLFEDQRTNLWVGTEATGIFLIKDGEVTSQGIGRGAFEKRLLSVCEDAYGAVWFYNANGELWRYANGRWNPFLFGLAVPTANRLIVADGRSLLLVSTDWSLAAIDSTPDPGRVELAVKTNLPIRKLDYLLASRSGGYWRLADGRVQKYQDNQLVQDLGGYHWGSARVSAACEDREGHLIVGTVGAGVFWYGTNGSLAHLSRSQGLSHDNVLSLCVDREGSLWVGTDGGGLNRVNRRVFEVLEVFGSPVQSVCEDAQGGLWIGSNNGGAAYWKDGELKQYGFNEGLLNPYVWSVLVDRSQRVWAGTWGGGLFQYQNSRFERVVGPAVINREVQAIFQDRNGRLWLGTRGGLACSDQGVWKVFTPEDGMPAIPVQGLAEDQLGNLWIGTARGGLYRWQNGKFTAYHKEDGLPSDDVSALLVGRDGTLWVGTSGSGLGRFQRGQWSRYGIREGLPSNSINYLLEDDQGSLWMGSNAGLLRVPMKALDNFVAGKSPPLPCRAYTKPDGLPTRECTFGSQPAACRTHDGRLWLPTIKGLVSVNPAELRPNPFAPPVRIESVWIDSRPVGTNRLSLALPPKMIIPARSERLEIRYTSLNLASADRARFRCWLEGHETTWREAGNNRVAYYSKLPPGTYYFHVKACNEDGLWNEAGSVLTILVEPPYWRTWWFLSATGICLLGMIVLVVHYLSTQKLQRQLERLKQQEALQHERARIARDLHDQLGANLTQISLLGELAESDKNVPGEVETHARQISQTARDTTKTLDEIVWTVNPSNDTLDGLVNYICKNAQDYLSVAGLRYRLEVPPQLPAVPISPEVRHNVFLAAKEAVTNIVRHARASEVRIRLQLDSAGFILEIEDNGVGLDEKAGQGRHGLLNMRKRMDDISGQFFIGPAAEKGTLVRLNVRLK